MSTIRDILPHLKIVFITQSTLKRETPQSLSYVHQDCIIVLVVVIYMFWQSCFKLSLLKLHLIAYCFPPPILYEVNELNL